MNQILIARRAKTPARVQRAEMKATGNGAALRQGKEQNEHKGVY